MKGVSLRLAARRWTATIEGRALVRLGLMEPGSSRYPQRDVRPSERPRAVATQNGVAADYGWRSGPGEPFQKKSESKDAGAGSNGS